MVCYHHNTFIKTLLKLTLNVGVGLDLNGYFMDISINTFLLVIGVTKSRI